MVLGTPTDSPHEDLQAFMSHWEQFPEELGWFVGKAMGNIGSANIPQFDRAFGVSYFSRHRVCDRIDYLYDVDKSSIPGCSQIVEERANLVCVRSVDGATQIVLIRDYIDGNMYYSVRQFSDGALFSHCTTTESTDLQYEIDTDGWNFQRPDDPFQGVDINPECEGFYNRNKTVKVCDMIRFASNILGYKFRFSA